MRIKVEQGVDWYVRKRCTPEEQDEFYKQLQAIESEPIKNSEACVEPDLSPYVCRFFRFGTNKAIFELDAFKSQIRVLECRKLKPSPHRRPGPPPPSGPPGP